MVGRASERSPAGYVVHAFGDSLRFAKSLAAAMATPLAPVDLHHFPDRESRVRVQLPVAAHAVVVRHLHDPNSKLVETVLAADALRRAGARRVTLVAPYLPYMRQDKVFQPGEAISQRVVGSCLGRAFDRVLTLEPHLHRVHALNEVIPRSHAVSAVPALAAWFARVAPGSLVVGPDEESAPWVRRVAAAARAPWVVGKKDRLSDRNVRISFPALPASRRAVLVDDIASSGVTLAVAAKALRRQGIERIDAIVVHAIFAAGALARIRASGVRRIVSCDTVPHMTNAMDAAPLFLPLLKRGPHK